ncbi:MAG: FAD-binding protein [Flavobacteriaceae bacterium]|nr:FAD-binding protein [Bacteroidia bacterium]NNL60825.1 FAD-binding protein [Flavobacteriaceae bacterium]
MVITEALTDLQHRMMGELLFDDLHKAIYATDASVYRKLPIAVAYPRNEEDIKTLIHFAHQQKTSLIPRTAGTSLAGQCVGEGIVVDVSRHFTRIIDIDEKNKTVTVQPGVIRDELNDYLKPFGLFFGPNTSTSNRCMIGGMVGNNSSGTTSIKYGVTRDKVIKLRTLLSDGSIAEFQPISVNEFKAKKAINNLEGHIYNAIYKELNSKEVQKNINENYPKPEIHRRNTGYAIDELIHANVFDGFKEFNMCELLTGSEGTLAFTTEITLKLDSLPPYESIMVAAHFDSIDKCLEAVVPVMKHDLFTCEMMDKTILDCTKDNKTQLENRFFIEGDPKAILLCEIRRDTKESAEEDIKFLLETIKNTGLSYAHPVLKGKGINRALELRKAGLGLLANIAGDPKAIACIEDTAVALPDLARYIEEFSELMKNYGQNAVYYAHAGAGELHLRPILNLKKAEDIQAFKDITGDVAKLVKKYRGSFSGEHGDGIVRSGFIEYMIGSQNYKILERIKTIFDPENIFNPGKIVNPLSMDANLRYEANRNEPEITTMLKFEKSMGILREAEKCNGSGDCRKLPSAGGTMCPSYRATLNEKDTTRARANALREYLTNSEKANKFNHDELNQVFDLCIACKACASECPSSVDVASLKTEFEYQYKTVNGFSRRDKFFANATKYNKLASKFPILANFLNQNIITSRIIKKFYGIASKRSIPKVSVANYNKVIGIETSRNKANNKQVVLFIDEFTNYLDSDLAVDSIILLQELGYNITIIDHLESARSYISKGFLNEAKSLINSNINYITESINSSTKIIGIEPSAILTLKDESLKLADDLEQAEQIADRTFLIDEFLYKEMQSGVISEDQFTSKKAAIKFHAHCHHKSLGNPDYTAELLTLPKNYDVETIPSGCCGMAGSFGYEKEHYDISMQMGELTLFPAIRNASMDTIIVANGTSCRHQIKDGTDRSSYHPVTILKNALLIN